MHNIRGGFLKVLDRAHAIMDNLRDRFSIQYFWSHIETIWNSSVTGFASTKCLVIHSTIIGSNLSGDWDDALGREKGCLFARPRENQRILRPPNPQSISPEIALLSFFLWFFWKRFFGLTCFCSAPLGVSHGLL